MRERFITTTGVLDDAALAVARTARPWLGVLWLTAIPVRLMQAYLLTEVMALGRDARSHGGYLGGLALATVAAFALSLYGRAVYVRACRSSLELQASPGREVLRVGPRALAVYAYAAFLWEFLFYATSWTFVLAPVFVLFAGLAAAASHLEDRPHPLGPLRTVYRTAPVMPKGIAVVFVVAIPLVLGNLTFATQAALWIAEGVAGLDVASWSHLLRPYPFFPLVPAEPVPAVLAAVATSLILEPFWLAALTIAVSRAREKETGEDLARWFAALTGGRP